MVAVFSCDITTTEDSENVIASDKNFQFEVYKSGPYDFVMTSLQGDSIILKISNLDCKPTDFFKDRSRYFFTCLENNNEKTIWEIEEDLGRIMQLDLRENDLEEFEKLKK